jgi:hypothetical protein
LKCCRGQLTPPVIVIMASCNFAVEWGKRERAL